MAENKNSFLLYADLIHTVNKLSDEQSGKLLKHILKYVNDLEPEPENEIIDLVFEPIKQQLKRDLKNWELERKQRSDAGRKGGIARARNVKHRLAKPSTAKQTQANQADNVNVTVNDNVNVNVTDIEKRKTAFQKEVTEINSFYKIISDHLLNDMADGFLPYWTEMNKSKTKMKYEQEKTFDITRRLHTWKRNAEKFGKKESDQSKKVKPKVLDIDVLIGAKKESDVI